MFLRVFIVLFWIFTLLQPASAQTWRRRKSRLAQAPATGVDKSTANESTSQNDGAKRALRRTETLRWVWVSRTIDLTQQPGGEDNLMTLDGGPLLSYRPSVTLGLVIDDEGHVLTRMADATPATRR